MEEMMGLGLFSAASGAAMFEKCLENRTLSEIVAFIAWLALPLAIIVHLIFCQESKEISTLILISSVFIISFYLKFVVSRSE
tara:strand:- start:1464 stop:1709 length:246 start_codon:yes stop_codon:yes gene_type:complete